MHKKGQQLYVDWYWYVCKILIRALNAVMITIHNIPQLWPTMESCYVYKIPTG